MELLLLIIVCTAWFIAGFVAGRMWCEKKCLEVLELAMVGRRPRRL